MTAETHGLGFTFFGMQGNNRPEEVAGGDYCPLAGDTHDVARDWGTSTPDTLVVAHFAVTKRQLLPKGKRDGIWTCVDEIDADDALELHGIVRDKGDFSRSGLDRGGKAFDSRRGEIEPLAWDLRVSPDAKQHHREKAITRMYHGDQGSRRTVIARSRKEQKAQGVQ